jgi:WD40 repeat protein
MSENHQGKKENFPLYRHAYEELYEQAQQGRCCHILSPRLTGKTQLLQATKKRLREEEGIICIEVDIRRLHLVEEKEANLYLAITQEIAHQFFSITTEIASKQVNLNHQKEYKKFLRQRREAKPCEWFKIFLEVVLLEYSLNRKITIFFDNIECLLEKRFLTRDSIKRFFESIFEFFSNASAKQGIDEDPFTCQINLIQFGAAAEYELAWNQIPGDLKVISRFIELGDCGQEDFPGIVDVFKKATVEIEGIPEDSLKGYIAKLISHTGGQPRLIEYVYELIKGKKLVLGDLAKIDTLASCLIKYRGDHLKIQTQVVLREDIDLLRLYIDMRKNYVPHVEQNIHHQRLVYLGLCRVSGKKSLESHNQIYTRIFDEEWLESNQNWLIRTERGKAIDAESQEATETLSLNDHPSAKTSFSEDTPTPDRSDFDMLWQRIKRIPVVFWGIFTGLPLNYSLLLAPIILLLPVFLSEEKARRAALKLVSDFREFRRDTRERLDRLFNSFSNFHRKYEKVISRLVIVLFTFIVIVSAPEAIAAVQLFEINMQSNKALLLFNKEGRELSALQGALEASSKLESYFITKSKLINQYALWNSAPAKFNLHLIYSNIHLKKQLVSPDKDFKEFWSVGLSPDTKLIAAGAAKADGEANWITLWDVQTGELTHSWQASQNKVTSLKFLDSEHIISAGDDGFVKLWELKTNPPKEIDSWDSHRGDKGQKTISDLDVNLDRDDFQLIAVAKDNSKVKLNSVESLKFSNRHKEFLHNTDFESRVTGVSIRPYSNSQFSDCLATAGQDGVVRLWNFERSELTDKFETPHLLKSISFNSDGNMLAVGGSDVDGSTGIIELRQVSSSCRFEDEQSRPIETAFPVNKILLYTNADPTGKDKHSDNLLIAVGKQGLLEAWTYSDTSEKESETVRIREAHSRSEIRDVDYNFSKPQEIVTVGSNPNIKIWNLGKPIQLLEEKGLTNREEIDGKISNMIVRFDELQTTRKIFCLSESNNIRTVQTFDEALDVRGALGDTSKTTSIAVDENGRHLITGDEIGQVRFWNWSSNQEFENSSFSTETEKAISSLAFNPNDDDRIVLAKDDIVQFWDWTDKRKIGQDIDHRNAEGDSVNVFVAKWSSDGEKIAVLDVERSVAVYDVSDISDPSRPVFLRDSNGNILKDIQDFQFHPSQNIITAVLRNDDDIGFWNLSGKRIGIIKTTDLREAAGFEFGRPTWEKIKFNRDGSLIVAGGNNQVRVWQVPEVLPHLPVFSSQLLARREVALFEGDFGSIANVGFDADNKAVFAASENGQLMKGRIRTKDLLDLGRRWLGEN